MTKNYDVLLYDFPCFLYKMKNHAFFLDCFVLSPVRIIFAPRIKKK